MFFRRKKKELVKKPVVSRPIVSNSAPTPRPVSMPLNSAAPAIDPTRKRRAVANKTRLMGFDTSDGRVVDLFDSENATKETARITYPVGLVMIVKGPGTGECFALKSGMSQIGRGEDQAVRLDFGDQAISRSNHAAIAYDPKDRTFLLGHGGKSNVVRLNGKPVVSATDLKDGNEIEIGETKMRFVAICSKKFNWEDVKESEGSDDDDMEIA